MLMFIVEQNLVGFDAVILAVMLSPLMNIHDVIHKTGST